jgi:hypothetical protein
MKSSGMQVDVIEQLCSPSPHVSTAMHTPEPLTGPGHCESVQQWSVGMQVGNPGLPGMPG